MSRHISGEPEAMRVVSRKPVAQSAAWVFGSAGIQNQIRQRRRDDVRQMARTADKQIMLRGVHFQNARTKRFPELFQLADGDRVGFFGRRENIDGIRKQIRPRSQHTHFFAAGHRMTADKMRAGLW